jgi:site-specific recombinase XerD
MTNIVQTQPVHVDLAETYHLLISLVLDAVPSPHTKRAYNRALKDFIDWYLAQDQPLTKATVHRYRSYLEDNGFSASNINQRLAAIRKLVREATDNGLMDERLAGGILRVKSVKQLGRRLGNWLSSEDAKALIDAPPKNTLKGQRDRAMLAIMLGCGLRRSEVVTVKWGQIQKRFGRWVLVDIEGKGGRVRSVAIPRWVKVALDDWCRAGELSNNKGPVFKTVNRWGQVQRDKLSVDTVLDTVRLYGRMIGEPELAPHDLRRTCAKLAYKGGAKIIQIQKMLGHASVQTTERYLGLDQDFENAPNDLIGLNWGAS